MTAIIEEKIRDKMMREKTLKLKKTIEIIKQDTYEKKQEKYDTGGVNFRKAKAHIQRRTDARNGKIRCEPRSRKRPKSEAYLRLKNSKMTSKSQVFSSTVPHGEKVKEVSEFFKKFFRKFLWSPVSCIVPKNVKGGPVGLFEHPFSCKIGKN